MLNWMVCIPKLAKIKLQSGKQSYRTYKILLLVWMADNIEKQTDKKVQLKLYERNNFGSLNPDSVFVDEMELFETDLVFEIEKIQ